VVSERCVTQGNQEGVSDKLPLVLVHLAAGIGNIVLATPLLVALRELGFDVDVWLAADYSQTADLLRPWSVVREVFAGSAQPRLNQYTRVVPAAPPFYWPRLRQDLLASTISCAVQRTDFSTRMNSNVLSDHAKHPRR
jgi:hypothetical protein